MFIFRWCLQDLTPIITYNKNGLFSDESRKSNYDLFISGHPSEKKITNI